MFNGIDISSWDAGIDLEVTPYSFIIIKATESTTYVNPYYHQHLGTAIGRTDMIGAYHFMRSNTDWKEQADYFIAAVANDLGSITLWLDWEEDAVALGPGIAKLWLDYVAKETGTTPGIYMSKSVANMYDWSEVAYAGYPLWGAQYASNDDIYDYDQNPWQSEQPWGVWGDIPFIFQYSSCGILPGFSGRLDMNLGYFEREDWDSLISYNDKIDEKFPVLPPDNCLSYEQRASEVMQHLCEHDSHGYTQGNRWGNGEIEEVRLSDGTAVYIALGDRDCSSAVISAWEAVLPGSTGGASYTGNMRECFLSTGLWSWQPMGNGYIAQPGDIYLNEVHHTAMCLSAEPDILGQFSISENNTVYGIEGDQTDQESNIRQYYNYPWDGKLVYIGPEPTCASLPEVEEGEQEPPIDGNLEVDGYWGAATTGALQAYYGLVVDGEVWHQYKANISKNPGLTYGWICDDSGVGSPVIKFLQNDLGVKVDGIFGPDTISALQKRMGTVVDGVLDAGSPCIKELQNRLNRGQI